MTHLTSNDGTRLGFSFVQGPSTQQRPPLILVDGPLCFRQNGVVTNVAADLSEHFALYTYDRRGRGESSDARKNTPYSIDLEVQDLDVLARVASRHSGGQLPIVCGFSTGATLALMAVHSGVAVSGLGLFEPPFTKLTPNDNEPPVDAALRLQQFLQRDDRSAAVHYFLTAVLGIPSFVVSLMKLAMRDAWRRSMSAAHTLPYDLVLLNGGQLPRLQLSGLRIPTVLIHCEQSPAILKRAVHAAAGAIKSVVPSMLTLPGKSHQLRGPDLANALLLLTQ